MTRPRSDSQLESYDAGELSDITGIFYKACNSFVADHKGRRVNALRPFPAVTINFSRLSYPLTALSKEACLTEAPLHFKAYYTFLPADSRTIILSITIGSFGKWAFHFSCLEQ